MQKVGAYSEEKKATEEVQHICDQVKSKAEEKAGTTFNKFEAISYRSQVVEGTNYIIKTDVGDTPLNYVHLYVHQSLPSAGSAPVVNDMKTGMEESAPLKPINWRMLQQSQALFSTQDSISFT